MAPGPLDDLDDPEALQAAFAAQLAEDGLGPQTLSQGISAAHDEPDRTTSGSGSTSPPVQRELHADPRLLALVEGRLRPEIARTHSLPQYAGELPFHLDPFVWRTGFLEVTEGGPPLELREGMRELTPQALLRDLYRPVRSTAPVPLDLLELPLDPGGRAAFAELRSARRMEPLPILERSVLAVAAVQAERRAFLSTPWQTHLADEAPRKEVFVAIEPSLTR